jgi:hypothetical protein
VMFTIGFFPTPYLTLTFAAPNNLGLIAQNKTFRATAMAKIWKYSEVKSGDENFDSKYKIFATDAQVVQNLLSAEQNRRSFERIFSQGYRMICFQNNLVFAHKMNFKHSDLEVARIQGNLDELQNIAVAANRG